MNVLRETTAEDRAAGPRVATNSRQEATSRTFSTYAPLYDGEMNANPVARWTRRRSLAALDAVFGSGDRVLEIGCGTGTEALHLAARGLKVVAMDPAPAMIEVVRRKAAAMHNAEERIITRVLPAGSLGELTSEFGCGYFDGAYSSLGPLNCEPSLVPAAEALAHLVRPGGRLLLSLLNPYCLWETAWYLRARRPQAAFRRWHGLARSTVRAEWTDEQVEVFYWRISAVEKVFSPCFTLVGKQALPWILPPQYLGGLVTKYPRLFKLLERIERKSAAVWPFFALGDHYLLEFIRTNEATAAL